MACILPSQGGDEGKPEGSEGGPGGTECRDLVQTPLQRLPKEVTAELGTKNRGIRR